MSDTPKTDAAIIMSLGLIKGIVDRVDANFARDLERRLKVAEEALLAIDALAYQKKAGAIGKAQRVALDALKEIKS